MKKIILAIMSVVVVGVALAGCGQPGGDKADAGDTAPVKAASVNVDMYIMSKCPYGVQVVDGFAPVLKTLGPDVALNLHYIGTEDDSGKLVSMHGEEEVAGDKIQLCAAKVAPQKHMAMLECMNRNWQKIPAGWEDCAKSAGIDAKALGACVDGDEGKKLLSESFAKAKEAGAQGSPTIKINGEEYQGGRGPRDFTKYICDKFGEKEGIKACADLPPPPKVLVTAISDKRCGEKCDPANLFKSLSEVFGGLEPRILDWSEAETRKLCEELEITMLPAVVFDETIKADPDGMKQLERWLVQKGEHHLLKVKPEFDPTAEICDNGADDTGDGKVDCDDVGCVNSMVCRPETAKNLEVFIMSQCPYGMIGVKAMKELLDAMGKDISFQIHYIADEVDGKIDSMHGPGEVEEDIRMLCAAKHFPKGNKYLEYLWCRGANMREPDWKTCTGKNGINADVIEKCVAGEGDALLREDIKIAKGLGIGASPTWVVNGKTEFNGIVAHDIQKQYCEKNPGLKGCDVKLAGNPDSHAGHGHGGEGLPPGMLPQGAGQAPPPACGQ